MRKTCQNLAIALSFGLLVSACGSKTSEIETTVTGVAYIGASVGNLDDSTAFYTQTTAMEDVQTSEIAGVNALDEMLGRENVSASARMLRSVNAQVRYMEFDQKSESAQQTSSVPVNGPGIAHVCFQVNKDTGTYEKFLAAGGQHIGARDLVQLSKRNPVEYAYATDKDGLIVEIEHVDVTKLDLETPPKNSHRIRHVSLATPDMDRLTDFYSAFLGQKKPRRIGRFGGVGNEAISKVSGLDGTKIKMTWYQLRNLELELIQYTSHPTESLTAPRPLDANGYNMIVFDVTDLDAAKAAFIAAGGTIISEPESMDGGQIMFGRDPDLNLIGLQVPQAGSVVSSEHFENNGME